MDETHPLAYGYMGMHGWKHTNRAIQSADLLIAFGILINVYVHRDYLIGRNGSDAEL